MSEKMDIYREWLGAYADGELIAERRAWLEDHLAACPDCQQELRELRALSALLHADPLPAPSATPDVFSKRVIAHLPPSQPTRGQRLLQSSLRYVPMGLFAAYAFFQAVILVSGGLLLTLNWLPGGQQLSALVPALAPGGEGALTSLFGLAVNSSGLSSLLEPVESWLVETPWTNPLALLNLFLIFVLGVFFCTWLAALWSHNHMRQTHE